MRTHARAQNHTVQWRRRRLGGCWRCDRRWPSNVLVMSWRMALSVCQTHRYTNQVVCGVSLNTYRTLNDIPRRTSNGRRDPNLLNIHMQTQQHACISDACIIDSYDVLRSVYHNCAHVSELVLTVCLTLWFIYAHMYDVHISTKTGLYGLKCERARVCAIMLMRTRTRSLDCWAERWTHRWSHHRTAGMATATTAIACVLCLRCAHVSASRTMVVMVRMTVWHARIYYILLYRHCTLYCC